MAEFSHIPVLLNETIELLDVKEGGVYVDATLGGAGHSKAIEQKNNIKMLVGVDQDQEALAFAKKNLSDYDNVVYVHNNFRNIDEVLDELSIDKVDGILIVHRIVGIEEPNAAHPNERYFLLQGDAVGSADRFPVRYSQIKGIYKGEKIPFIGSFILFIQSFTGWLCIALVFFALIITPIVEKKLYIAKKQRYKIITENSNTQS